MNFRGLYRNIVYWSILLVKKNKEEGKAPTPPPLLNLKNKNKKTKQKKQKNPPYDQHYHNVLLPLEFTSFSLECQQEKKIMTYKKNEKIKCYESKFRVQHMGQKFIFTIGVWYNTVLMNPP